MAEPAPIIDIHCHLLPELDDGAASWDDAVAMARMAAADGVTACIVTPHQLGAFGRNRGECIRAQTARFQALLDREGIALRGLPGAEARIEPGLVAKLQSGDVLTLADRRRHVLLELPHEVYLPVDRLLTELSAAGMVPILAHPERNAGILARPEVLPPLVEAGCLLQVTAGSVLGAFGPATQALAQRLIRQGLVDFLATDAHGVRSRRPLLSRGMDWVSQAVGLEVALDLCCRNPACVAEGRDIPTSHARPTRSQLGRWLRRKAG
jgi:protein-tyrosine phosphatase